MTPWGRNMYIWNKENRKHLPIFSKNSQEEWCTRSIPSHAEHSLPGRTWLKERHVHHLKVFQYYKILCTVSFNIFPCDQSCNVKQEILGQTKFSGPIGIRKDKEKRRNPVTFKFQPIEAPQYNVPFYKIKLMIYYMAHIC